MGLFSKKKKRAVMAGEFNSPSTNSEIPELPRLPELPLLPGMKEKDFFRKQEPLPQLPIFPTNPLGEKFSQNTIKHAVSGDKKGDEDANDLALSEIGGQEMRKAKAMEIESFESIPKEFKQAARMVKEAEPVFIRIDKFEEAMRSFEKIRLEISEIEHGLKETQKIKQEEEKELELWENEIKTIKSKIDKIDRDIFSKIN